MCMLSPCMIKFYRSQTIITDDDLGGEANQEINPISILLPFLRTFFYTNAHETTTNAGMRLLQILRAPGYCHTSPFLLLPRRSQRYSVP